MKIEIDQSFKCLPKIVKPKIVKVKSVKKTVTKKSTKKTTPIVESVQEVIVDTPIMNSICESIQMECQYEEVVSCEFV